MINSTKQLLVQQLNDLYDAENQLLDAMPVMSKQATDERLRVTLEEHHDETLLQADRLEKALDRLGEKPTRMTCQGMKGLIAEAKKGMQQAGHKSTRDLSIVAQGLRIEHYEKAGYLMAVHLAESMDYDEVEELLSETLAEEENAAELLESLVDESYFDTIKGALGGKETALT